MKLHSCFGEDGQLQVFDVWESQAAFDEFLTYLGPVMEELHPARRSRPRSCRLWTLSSNSGRKPTRTTSPGVGLTAF